NTDEYFAALTAYREGNASPIIAQFADASRFAAARGRRLVDDLAQQTRESEERIVDIRADAAARRVIPLLVGQPVVNVAYIQKRLDLNERAAFRAIDALVTRGILVERAGRSRNRVYALRGILGVLDS